MREYRLNKVKTMVQLHKIDITLYKNIILKHSFVLGGNVFKMAFQNKSFCGVTDWEAGRSALTVLLARLGLRGWRGAGLKGILRYILTNTNRHRI